MSDGLLFAVLLVHAVISFAIYRSLNVALSALLSTPRAALGPEGRIPQVAVPQELDADLAAYARDAPILQAFAVDRRCQSCAELVETHDASTTLFVIGRPEDLAGLPHEVVSPAVHAYLAANGVAPPAELRFLQHALDDRGV